MVVDAYAAARMGEVMKAGMNPQMSLALGSVATQLAARFRRVFSDETVARPVAVRLDKRATVRSMFIPALVEQYGRRRSNRT